ncbi:hypothetical protein [Tissierella praeacuta]|uniref:hypothetical protein n=1 Tax=Tissierella praeacuta TaxID=43131 RepID=UPI0033425896
MDGKIVDVDNNTVVIEYTQGQTIKEVEVEFEKAVIIKSVKVGNFVIAQEDLKEKLKKHGITLVEEDNVIRLTTNKEITKDYGNEVEVTVEEDGTENKFSVRFEEI